MMTNRFSPNYPLGKNPPSTDAQQFGSFLGRHDLFDGFSDIGGFLDAHVIREIILAFVEGLGGCFY
jgi:hypothetical protein